MSASITQLSAAELIYLIQRQDLSPVEVTNAFLAKILDTRTSLNAFVDVYEKQVRATAERACRAIRRGRSLGPLHGMPIALKDLFNVEGELTTGGSLCWRHQRPSFTSPVVAGLVNRGMVLLGKTHTVEFGLGAFGINEHFGTPRNPWSTHVPLAPGGSSSGSAVAVAAGLTPWSLGTDTGGSVRIPASWCGVVGLKPSYGQIDMRGVIPLSQTLDSVGIIARTVEDASLLYSHLLENEAARRLHDKPCLSPPINISKYSAATLPSVEYPVVAAEVLICYEEAIAKLSSLGLTTKQGLFPASLDDCLKKNSIITFYEAFANYRSIYQDVDSPLGSAVRTRLSRGASITHAEYLAALREMNSLRLEFDRIFDEVDAIVLPTTQIPACALECADASPPPNHFTRFVNFMNLCAIAVPSGFTKDGRPCSLQIVCRHDQENIAIDIAQAYEASTPWHLVHPPSFTSV